MLIAQIIVWTFIGYAAAGMVFGVYFVVAGAKRTDPAAKASGMGFRFIIFPGTVALWPLLLLRLVKGTHRPEERNAHRNAVREGNENQ